VIEPKWLREVHAIVEGEAFGAWYGRYVDLRQAVEAARERNERLALARAIAELEAELTQRRGDDTVYRAGERADLAARADAERVAVENDSFDALSVFEAQRTRTRDLWQEVLRLEAAVDDRRRAAAEARAALESSRHAGHGDQAGSERRLVALEGEVASAGAALDLARGRLAREEARRDELWAREEGTWSAGFRAGMARAEYAFQGRRLRRAAEELFARAAVERRRAETLAAEERLEDQGRAELEAALARHRELGEAELRCAIVDEFLYWPEHERPLHAWCVPLVDEASLLGAPVVALRVYEVAQDSGLEQLSLAPEATRGPAGSRPPDGTAGRGGPGA
jgi:hypothetical protein